MPDTPVGAKDVGLEKEAKPIGIILWYTRA